LLLLTTTAPPEIYTLSLHDALPIWELSMEVREAANGLEALDQLKQDPDIELVLVDWNMPEMNGLDFIRAVRAQTDYAGLRILMRSEEHTSELQSRENLVCRLLLEKK